jgi:hypothetical protein
VAFKKDSMWLGRYVGSPFIWEWKPIAYDIGCIGKGACVNAGEHLYFIGPRGFYVFDGSYPRLIPGFVHETWASQYSTQARAVTYADYASAYYDPDYANVVFHMTVDLTTGCASANDVLAPGADRSPQLSYTYNTKSGIWTHSVTSENAFEVGAATGTVALIGPQHGVSGNKLLAAFDYGETDTSLGFIKTPRMGGPELGLILKGFWPNWSGSVALPNTTWQGAVPSAAFNAFNATASSATSATQTPAANGTYARLEGTVAGMWVQAETSLKNFAFDGVHLDIERTGSRR